MDRPYLKALVLMKRHNIIWRGKKGDFAPENGNCYSCREHIYTSSRIKDEHQRITGCPHCSRTFCD